MKKTLREAIRSEIKNIIMLESNGKKSWEFRPEAGKKSWESYFKDNLSNYDETIKLLGRANMAWDVTLFHTVSKWLDEGSPSGTYIARDVADYDGNGEMILRPEVKFGNLKPGRGYYPGSAYIEVKLDEDYDIIQSRIYHQTVISYEYHTVDDRGFTTPMDPYVSTRE